MNLFNSESEESFYVAGFLAADGCITDTNRICVTLARKDLEHIKVLKFLLGCKNPIGFRTRDNSKNNPKWKISYLCNFSFASREMCKQLARFNIVPRKTFIYEFPEWLKDHPLKHHFMRGYFDGDGCIHFGKPQGRATNGQFILNVAGTDAFVKTFGSEVSKSCDANQPKILGKKTKIISYHGNRSVGRVCSFLYRDSSLYLGRKAALAFQAIQHYNEYIEREKMLEPEMLLPLWKEHRSVNRLIPILRRDRKTIKAKLLAYGAL